MVSVHLEDQCYRSENSQRYCIGRDSLPGFGSYKKNIIIDLVPRTIYAPNHHLIHKFLRENHLFERVNREWIGYWNLSGKKYFYKEILDPYIGAIIMGTPIAMVMREIRDGIHRQVKS